MAVYSHMSVTQVPHHSHRGQKQYLLHFHLQLQMFPFCPLSSIAPDQKHWGNKDRGEKKMPKAEVLLHWGMEAAEVIPATICAFIMSEHSSHMEKLAVSCCPRPLIDFNLQQPSSALVLVSCLVYGVSVSSFVYRHHQRHPARISVLLMGVVATVMAAGCVLGVGLNALLLCWLPWAVNAMMVVMVTVVLAVVVVMDGPRDARAKQTTGLVREKDLLGGLS